MMRNVDSSISDSSTAAATARRGAEPTLETREPADRNGALAPAPRQFPVTVFEALMLAQETARHPMTAQLEADYTGRLDRSAFESALARTLAEHPLLQSLIDDPDHPRLWTVRTDRSPYVDWGRIGSPLSFPEDREFVDLRREIGLRVWVRAGPESGRILFQFHHACTDGTGVLAFVTDLLQFYDRIARDNQDAACSPRRKTAHLAERDRFHPHPRRNRMRMLLRAIVRGPRWSRMNPIALSSPSPAAGVTRPMSTVLHGSLSLETLERLLAHARRRNATLNDLMLRDLFRLLARDPHAEPACSGDGDVECLEGAAPRDPTKDTRENLVICMPVNLRRPADNSMPAANKLMLTFLKRPRSACANSEKLLRSLNRETRSIKASQRGLAILEVLRLAMRSTGGIPQGLLKKTSFATAVLTNLGRLDGRHHGLRVDQRGRFLAGPLVIEQIISAPNGLPGTPAVFVASTYGNRLVIAIHHNPADLSKDRARDLLDRYLDQLRHTAETA